MAPPNNNNIFYLYILSLFCSFSVTATSSWIAHVPLSWWPFLIPVLFMLVIISTNGSGFLQLNSGTEYMLTENAPIDPGPSLNQNVPQVTPLSPEHHTDDYRMNGYEDDRGTVLTMTGTHEIEIEEIKLEEISEDESEQNEKCDENTNGDECLYEDHRRNRITLEMLLSAQAKFERKQEAYVNKRRRKIKRGGPLVPSFLRCFSF